MSIELRWLRLWPNDATNIAKTGQRGQVQGQPRKAGEDSAHMILQWRNTHWEGHESPDPWKDVPIVDAK